jgi:hypothetical protein
MQAILSQQTITSKRRRAYLPTAKAGGFRPNTVKTKTKAKTPKQPAPPVALPPGAPVLLSADQVATCLGISYSGFGGLVRSGAFPGPDLRVLGKPRWTPETVAAWIAAQPRENTNARRLPAQG